MSVLYNSGIQFNSLVQNVSARDILLLLTPNLRCILQHVCGTGDTKKISADFGEKGPKGKNLHFFGVTGGKKIFFSFFLRIGLKRAQKIFRPISVKKIGQKRGPAGVYGKFNCAKTAQNFEKQKIQNLRNRSAQL